MTLNGIFQSSYLRTDTTIFHVCVSACSQQHLKRLDVGRKEAELLVAHCRQLQREEGLSQSLGELEGAFGEADLKSDVQEHNLQVRRRYCPHWSEFIRQRVCRCLHSQVSLISLNSASPRDQ